MRTLGKSRGDIPTHMPQPASFGMVGNSFLKSTINKQPHMAGRGKKAGRWCGVVVVW